MSERLIARLERAFGRFCMNLLVAAALLYVVLRIHDYRDPPVTGCGVEILPAPDVETCYRIHVNVHFEAFGPNPDSWPGTIAGR